MSSSGERTLLKLVTVGDFDPQSEKGVEYDFIGRMIAGRYIVREHIGGGGMADVFQASDEQLGVDVAIKLLKPRMASDELRARMVQEAQAAAQVRHSNVVRVFGTGKLDATAYIAMELLAGPNLEQYVREYRGQRIAWKEALDLLLPALDGLHAIHERGYIHRDIKPGNILVTREPGCPPQAIIIDLGLVKPDRALRNADSPPTTEAGRMLIPPAIATVIESALRKNPNDRPRTMEVFADALRAAARESPAAPSSSPMRRPHWLLLASALGVTLTWLVTTAMPLAPSVDPEISALHVDPEAVATPTPSTRTLADEQPRSLATAPPVTFERLQPDPRPSLTASSPGETEAIERQTTAARRVLAGRVAVVQRCVDQTIGDIPRLVVAMKVNTSGRVSAHVVRAADSTLSRCLDGALKDTPIAPPAKSLTFVQVFNLRAMPLRR